ncbi:MAG: hypothetical protein ABI317_08190, partial [Gaiellales bacterium]
MTLTFAVALALLAAVGTATAATARPPIVGATMTTGHGKLVQLDPLTLEPRGAPLATFALPWSVVRSSSGVQLGLAAGDGGLRVIDATTGAIVRRLAIGQTSLSPAILTPTRLLAITGTARSSVVVADPRTDRVIGRRPLGGTLIGGAASHGRLVLLVGPTTGLGTTRLVVVSSSGHLRAVALPQIRSGMRPPLTSNGSVRDESPGLAVDPSGARAAIVDGDGRVVIVNLRTLGSETHRVVLRSLAAAQKQLTGWNRQAAWLAPNVLAVSGVDYASRPRPAGLRLIDT